MLRFREYYKDEYGSDLHLDDYPGIDGDWYGDIKYHLNGHSNRTGLFSFSEYPEISWLAVTQNYDETANNWTQDDECVIYRGRINSFYVLDRKLFATEIRDESSRIGDKTFHAADDGFEVFTLIAFPEEFLDESNKRIFSRENPPQSADWEDNL